MCVYMYEHICQVVCVEAREQPVGVHFLIPQFSASGGLNSGGQADSKSLYPLNHLAHSSSLAGLI